MGGAVRAEIRKIFTTRLWWGMLFGVVLIGGGVSALFASLVGTTQAGADPADNPFLKMSVGTAHDLLGRVLLADRTPDPAGARRHP